MEFKEIDTAVVLTPADFKPPAPPEGWETVRMPLGVKPADK